MIYSPDQAFINLDIENSDFTHKVNELILNGNYDKTQT
jgi:hypothetical protein